jgi:hypothetical protein
VRRAARLAFALLLGALLGCGTTAATDAAMTGDAGPRADTGPAPDAGPRADGSIDDASTDASAMTMDSGAPDPFSTDRTLFFGASRCPADLVLCDGFETVSAGSDADPAVWMTIEPGLSVETTDAARGGQALHVVTHSTESLHFIRTTRTAASLSRRMWGRLFFRKDGTRPGSFNHWTVAEATGTHPAGGTARIRYGGIMVPDVVDHYIFNYDIWGGSPSGFHEVGAEDDVDISDHEWHCIEWMFDVDARQSRFFEDSVERPAMEAMGSIDGIDLDFPPMDGLNIGWAIYQDLGTDTWDVWVDEVAADDERIGCAR